MARMELKPADEVRKLASEVVIPQWHPHLAELRFVYLFADELPEQKGRATMAKVKRLSSLESHLAGDADLAMLVDSRWWARLTAKQRTALVDHELCHVRLNQDGDPKLVGHDLEEFVAVVKRHGAWMPDVAVFGEAIQMHLLPA